MGAFALGGQSNLIRLLTFVVFGFLVVMIVLTVALGSRALVLERLSHANPLHKAANNPTKRTIWLSIGTPGFLGLALLTIGYYANQQLIEIGGSFLCGLAILMVNVLFFLS